MKNSQYLTKNTTAALLLSLLVLVASMSMVAYADDHQNVVEYDVDDVNDVDVPYNSLVEVTDASINNGDTYVLYNNSDGRTSVTATADADGIVVFDTSVLGDDYNPKGAWDIKALEAGEVTASTSQTTNGSAVEFDMVRANVDYVVSIHEIDASGNVVVSSNLGSQQFNAGERVEYSNITLNSPIADGNSDDVVIAVSEQGATLDDTDDLLDESDVITVTSDEDETAPVTTTPTTGDYPRESHKFSIVDALDVTDDRVELDVLDNGNSESSIARVWVGQQLVLAGDSLDADATYDLMRQDNDGEGYSLVREIAPVKSNTTNIHEFNIDSGFPNADVEAKGDFKIVGPSGTEVMWNAVQQDLNAELNESVVNLHTENTQVDLNVTSIRSGPYDVLVSAENVTADELVELVDESKLDSGVEVQVEDAEDDDNEQVRITNVQTSGENVFTVPLEFDGSNEQEYEFSLSVADATAAASTGLVDVAFFDEGDATFNQGTYVQDQGDQVTFEITMSDTSVSTFKFTEDDYELEFDVRDTDNSGTATITMDTYRAGDGTEGYTVDQVFKAGDEGTEIENSQTSLPAVSGPFATGLYTMELSVNNQDTDMGTLYVTDRASEEINTWVMPMDKAPTMENVEEFGTQQDKVALNDKFVVEVKASGLYSDTLLTNNTTGADLVDHYERTNANGLTDTLPELGLHITETDSDRHSEATRLKLEEAEHVEVVPEDDTFYVFFNTGEDDIYDTFDSDFDVNKETEFDVDLNITEDYKYVDDDADNESADLYESVEFVERVIVTNLPSVVVDEETLETKHGLAAVENSTVSGYTNIAPYTTGIDVIVRTADSESQDIESEFFSNSVEVTEEGTVFTQFDLSNIDVDRAMELRFRPVDADYREAVMMEADVPPEIANFGSDDTPVTEGNEVGFNLEVNSTNPDSLNYQWDFGDDEGTSAQSSPAYVYDSPGTYTVTVTVTDSAGQSDNATTEIVVEEAPNEPPTIEQIISPDSAEVGDDLTFTAIAFDDSDSNNQLQYTWDFDDGSTSAGISTTQSYDSAGTYDVSVTVTDSNGESTQQSKTVQVTDPDAGENETDSGPYDFTITAADANTSERIPGVSVTVSQEGETIETVTTDGNGISVVELENGEYNVTASVDGYETRESGTFIDGEANELQLDMTAEGGEEEEDPSQPGFGVILAAIAMMAGSMIAYRRKD